MTTGHDLDRAALAPVLGTRPFRTFPAMLSTEAEAMAWARAGAEPGSVVTAGYQAAPRGRSGLSWADRFTPSGGLGCSIVLRPDLPEQREGWLYVTTTLGVLDALAVDDRERPLQVEWPDQVRDGEVTVAAVGVQVDVRHGRVTWAVATVLVPDLAPPRAVVLARVVEAVERRVGAPDADVLDDYREVCATLGRRVRASVLPMGPASPSFVGRAEDVRPDGGLAIATDEGRHAVVAPQSLGFLEAPDAGPMGPPGLG